MARLIRPSRLEPSELHDARDEARRTLAEARAEAAGCVAAAESRAAAIETEARARGLDAVRAEHAALLLEAAAERASALARANHEVSALAVAVARKLLHAELSQDPEAIAPIVTHAVDRARGAARIELRLHPDDARTVTRLMTERAVPTLADAPIELVEDASIERGGCLVRTALGEVDARVSTRLDALLAALGG